MQLSCSPPAIHPVAPISSHFSGRYGSTYSGLATLAAEEVYCSGKPVLWQGCQVAEMSHRAYSSIFFVPETAYFYHLKTKAGVVGSVLHSYILLIVAQLF
jgi:hypothetical protein